MGTVGLWSENELPYDTISQQANIRNTSANYFYSLCIEYIFIYIYLIPYDTIYEQANIRNMYAVPTNHFYSHIKSKNTEKI